MLQRGIRFLLPGLPSRPLDSLTSVKISLPPKLNLALLPTRIERLARVSERVSREIYIKRDDLTEAAGSGNKIRKLEFLLKAALEAGADTLVTCGGLQSNHCRATALLGRRLGLSSVLILRGSPQEPLDGNFLLDRLLGAEVVSVTAEEYERRAEIFEEIASRLRAEGKKPYLIPEGGSNALGASGYVAMVEELLEQMSQQNLSFDSILCPVGSGGTLAGLLMGKYLYGLSAEIFGVDVEGDTPYLVSQVDAIIREARETLGFPVEVPAEAIHILEGYEGLGYAKSTPQEMSLIAEVAQQEGIVLDPVYTAKTFRGLMEEVSGKGERAGRLGRRILFLHTGGIFGLFPQRRLLETVLLGEVARKS